METLLGQFSSEGPITVWKFCPLFKGVGWGMIFNVFVTNIYYIMFVAYSSYYMLVAFVNIGDQLPWEHCGGNSWSTAKCNADPYPDFTSMTLNSKTQILRSMMDRQCLERTLTRKNISTISSTDFDLLRTEFAACEKIYTSPEDEYWNRFVLGVHDSDGFNNMGTVVARNAVILFVVWLIVFYCCVRGIRSIVKDKMNMQLNFFSSKSVEL
ncbi:Sodium-dependent noradrenaline transporter [Mactra antiquata]